MQRFFAGHRVITTAGLILLGITMLVSGNSTLAEETPAVSAAVDCTGIEPYIQELRTMRDDYRAAFVERLPGAPREWERRPGDMGLMQAFMDWAMWLTSATPEELAILTELWSTYAERLDALKPPPIAEAFHQELLSTTRSFADLYREEGSMAALALMAMPSLGGDPSTFILMSAGSDELATSCPVWAAFRMETPATPVTE